MTTMPQPPDTRRDAADDLRILGLWTAALAVHLRELPTQQRRQLLRAADDYRRDLDAIRLGVPR
jgi:hypothetical protein